MKSLIHNQFREKVFEIICVVILFSASWLFLAHFTGYPITWDELLYMDLSLNPIPDGRIWTRFAHVYLQKPFLELATSPIKGAQVFWGFVISTISVSIYFTAKKITLRSNFINGIAAVLLFLSSWLILPRAGTTYADFTATMFIVLAVTFYVYLPASRGITQKILLFFLGFVIALALRTKEVSVVLLTLIPGLFLSGATEQGEKYSLRQMLLLLAGVVTAFSFLFLLDQIIVGDAWFIFRRDTVSEYTRFTAGFTGLNNDGANWKGWLVLFLDRFIFYMGSYFTQWENLLWRLTVPILLYLITFLRFLRNRDEEINWYLFTVWLLPITVLLFHMAANAGYRHRFYYPGQALLMILGAQFFYVSLPIPMNYVRKRIAAISRTPSFYLLVLIFAIYAIFKFGPEFNRSYYGFVVTFSGASMLFMAVWIKKWQPTHSVFAILCVALFTWHGLYFEGILPLFSGELSAETSDRFRPFQDIEGDFNCDLDSKTYLTMEIYDQYDLLSRSLSSTPWMFNVYFDCSLDVSHFTFADQPNLPNDVVEKEYEYVFVTRSEFENIDDNGLALLAEKYVIQFIADERLVYFSLK